MIRSRLLRAGLTGAGVLVGACIAWAQDDPEVDCNNPVTQMDMNVCSDKDYEDADTDLNSAYKAAMTAMKQMDKELSDIAESYVGAVDALKKAQRAWIDYRDGQCELDGFQARGGSMEPMLVSGCLAEMTRKRTDELKALTESAGN